MVGTVFISVGQTGNLTSLGWELEKGHTVAVWIWWAVEPGLLTFTHSHVHSPNYTGHPTGPGAILSLNNFRSVNATNLLKSLIN